MPKAKLPFLALPSFAAKAAAAVYSFLFPSGSASSIVESTSVTITPYQHWNSQWLWWCVKHTNLAGQQPSFLVPKASRFDTAAAGARLAVWATAADTDTWTDFTTVTVGATNIEFQHGSAFTNKKIYIAAYPMYPFSRTQRLINVWDANSRVSDTPSSAGYIIASATARSADDGSGRTAPALPFYALKITNPSGYTKNKAILASGNHPDETMGRFALEGAITWLLGGSALAEFLLDYFEFYVYPCVNPQGVWAGYFRSCPEDKTLDHNRQWITGGLECIDAFKTAMNTDTGGAIEIGLDYHASTYDGASDAVYAVAYDGTEAVHALFAAEMAALDATFHIDSDAATNGQLRRLFRDTYSARLALTFEQGSINTRTITNLKNSGAYSLQAIAAMLADGQWTNGPGVGSREFNGTTDRIDWAAITDLTASPITIAAWVKSDGGTVNDYIIDIQRSGDTAAGIILGLVTNTTTINFLRSGSTSLNRNGRVTGVALDDGNWHLVIGTHDGSITDYTTMKMYVDGVECDTYTLNQNGASENAPTGSWSVGGRISDDARNWDGKICQVGVWSRVLTSTEIANLAAAQAPDLAAPTNLEFYFKGNTSSLDDEITSATGTADGTTQLTGVGTGPSIIY